MLYQMESSFLRESIMNCVFENIGSRIGILDGVLGVSRVSRVLKLCHFQVMEVLGYNVKMNGRYAFKTVLDFTEFFSVLFSAASLVSRIFYHLKYLRKTCKKTEMGKYYSLQSKLGMFMWFSSILLHYFETELHRNLDYFSALLFITVNLYFSVVRVMVELKCAQNTVKRVKDKAFWSLSLLYILFIYRMYFISFHKRAAKFISGTLMIFTLCLWLWLYSTLKNIKHSKYLLYSSMVVLIALALELSDLPPYRYLLDSHALWHLMSCIGEHWYNLFLYEDLLYLMVEEEKTK